QSVAQDQTLLAMRIKEITEVRIRYGYRRVHVMLQREGWHINHKIVYRLYSLQGLALRSKRPRRHKSAQTRQPKAPADAMNQAWSMDFVSDALFNGRRLRTLTVMDNFTRECLAIHVDASIRGEHVVEVMETLCARRAAPVSISVDNGPEFISKVLDKWVYEHKVSLNFSRPDKPTDNAYIESFNGRFREECLNANWFLSLEDARDKIDAWRQDYNEVRPHSALDWQTPCEFARQARACRKSALPQQPDFST
ncbi:IS3 family transposase, partial [Herbaspirillum sp. GCM10030257]|uniref:IS3 family transposase n=1 Tax=Herbaspirillum sp. GCM10030257 TaxID=3273393 RepID=UPI0036214E2A